MSKYPRIFITHNGKTQSLMQWSEETGIPRHVLYYRHKVSVTTDEIFREYGKENIGNTRMDVTEEKVLELRNKGMSAIKIADMLLCSEGTVRNRFKSLREKEREKC